MILWEERPVSQVCGLLLGRDIVLWKGERDSLVCSLSATELEGHESRWWAEWLAGHWYHKEVQKGHSEKETCELRLG